MNMAQQRSGGSEHTPVRRAEAQAGIRPFESTSSFSQAQISGVSRHNNPPRNPITPVPGIRTAALTPTTVGWTPGHQRSDQIARPTSAAALAALPRPIQTPANCLTRFQPGRPACLAGLQGSDSSNESTFTEPPTLNQTQRARPTPFRPFPRRQAPTFLARPDRAIGWGCSAGTIE